MTAEPSLPFHVWTDVPLDADAAAFLAAHVKLVGPILTPTADVADRLAGIDRADAAIVSTRFVGNATVFARAAGLRVLARVGIGYDNIDVAAATAAGIAIVNTPEAPTESTAEFAVGLMYAVARRITAADQVTRTCNWTLDTKVLGFDLAGKTLGLVGFGRIGRRVARIVGGLPMTVRAFDPFVPADAMTAAGVEPVADLATLLGSADVVSVHVPLSPQTRGMIGRSELAWLRPSAILINTSRGPVLDEAALADALRDGRLAGAGIDVWQQEPTAKDNPLLQLGTVVATPHLAAFTREGRRRSHTAAAQQVVMMLRGERPPALVNPEVWPRRRGVG